MLPPVIRCINVSGMSFADRNGPNYHAPWTYMTMARCALHNILQDESRVLYLDADTIVMFDVSELFETDLKGNVIGAVREPARCLDPFVYFNAGVLLMDLDQLRGGLGDDMLRLLNTRKLRCVDQDAINLLCQARILELNPIYNANDYTAVPGNAKIYHYAGDGRYAERRLFKSYIDMKWSEINARKE